MQLSAAKRKELSLSNDTKILLMLAWNTDEERRIFSLFPELLVEEDDVSTNQNEYDIEHSAESFSLYAGNTKYQSIIPATIWSEYATGELDKQNWKRSRHNNYNFGTSYVSEMAKIAEHSHDAHIAFNIVMPELLSRMQQAASQQYARENALLPNDTTHFDTVDDSVAVASHKLPKNNRRKKSCTSPRKNIR
jgi:hypothetical protein